MPRPSPEFLQIPKTLHLSGSVLILMIAVSLAMSTDSWSKAKQSAPAQSAPAKAPGWCSKAAPVVNGVATVTISPVGTTKNLKVDYDRVCITTTERVEWKWSGDATKEWSVEFYIGADPFPKNKYGKGNPKSDPPRVPANDHLIYKYMVHVDGYADLDPDVIIRGG